MKYLKNIDQLGFSVAITYKDNSTYQTAIGGIFTLIITGFTIFSSIYFGSDIIYKEKPNTRFSQLYTNQSQYYLKDTPLMIVLLDNYGNPIQKDVDQYITISSLYITITNGVLVARNSMFFELCNETRHFLNYGNLFNIQYYKQSILP